jgi:hypothetical protein
MARRSKLGNSKPVSRIDTSTEDEQHSSDVSALPHLAEFIEHGQIVIGIMAPAGCVAVAAEGRHALAMLQRQKGETFAQLLTRLDLAIARAMIDDIYTDEVNPLSR